MSNNLEKEWVRDTAHLAKRYSWFFKKDYVKSFCVINFLRRFMDDMDVDSVIKIGKPYKLVEFKS